MYVSTNLHSVSSSLLLPFFPPFLHIFPASMLFFFPFSHYIFVFISWLRPFLPVFFTFSLFLHLFLFPVFLFLDFFTSSPFPRIAFVSLCISLSHHPFRLFSVFLFTPLHFFHLFLPPSVILLSYSPHLSFNALCFPFVSSFHFSILTFVLFNLSFILSVFSCISIPYFFICLLTVFFTFFHPSSLYLLILVFSLIAPTVSFFTCSSLHSPSLQHPTLQP